MRTYRRIGFLSLAVIVFCIAVAEAETPLSMSSIQNKMCATDLYAVDSCKGHIWASSAGGAVYYSPDFGNSWQLQETGIPNELFSISFADEMNGWAVGRSGVIVHTADGGRTWLTQRKETPETHANLYKVQFIDSRKGWAVGEWSTIVYTTDGGKTWVETSLGEDRILFSMCFIDEKHGWIVGELGAMARTIDGGKTWAKQTPPEKNKSFYGVFFKDLSHGWACGIDGIILRTEDGGASWQQVPPTSSKENLYDIDLVGNKLWAIGMNGIMVTSENGFDWHIGVETRLTYQWLMDWVTTEKGEIVIAGAKGTVITSKDTTSWQSNRQIRICTTDE